MTAETPDMLLRSIRVIANEPDLDWFRPPTPIAGGFWAELWQVRLDTEPEHSLAGDLVARIMPDPHTAAKETMVQNYLANQGFATPPVRLWAPPTTELGSAWMLMDLVDGEPLMPSLDSATVLLKLPILARSLPDTLAQVSADLHRLPTTDLANVWPAENQAGNNNQTGHDHTDHYLQTLVEQSTNIDEPDITRFAQSLQQSRTLHNMASDSNVICHGDLQPFNILISKPDNTAVSTAPSYMALDWSTAQITNRCHDLAYTLLLLKTPPLSVPNFLSPIISVAGRFLAGRFVRSYERLSGEPVNPAHLEWFTALHALRVLIDVATWKHEGTLDQHHSHPYLLMEPALRAQHL